MVLDKTSYFLKNIQFNELLNALFFSNLKKSEWPIFFLILD